jgi:hypothetical protein
VLGKEVQKTSFSILTDELPYLIEQQDMLEFMMSAEKSRQCSLLLILSCAAYKRL